MIHYITFLNANQPPRIRKSPAKIIKLHSGNVGTTPKCTEGEYKVSNGPTINYL